jgi:tRNA dimethylallyltransferase
VSISTPTVIIIAGPTAVGKTAVAINVAKHFGTEIISADSRQCYKELNIGVARPSEEELTEVKHHFIASHSIHEKVTAITFEQYALEKAEDIFSHHNIAVLVGGTGLYIKALTDGLDLIPDIPTDVRNSIIEQYDSKGLSWLQEEVRRLDPAFHEKGEIKNPQRLMRALEVVRFTGQSILQYRANEKTTRPFNVVKFALSLPKEKLHENINTRVDQMMEHGLLEEVRSLIPYKHLNALQTVGYKELFDYFNGETTIADAVEAIKKNTRQYAKRQLTWFRKDKDYQWIEPSAEAVLTALA